MAKTWRFFPYDEARVRAFCQALQVSPLTAQVLIARGMDSPGDGKKFLETKLTDLHDPSLLPGISEATERVVSAIKAERKVTIYGDYDVDGVTATALLWNCLKLAGAEVDYYIPCRLEEGYGLNCDAIRQLAESDPKQLVISVDCGISSVEEAALAKELGLELIITDHHQFEEELPDAACLVHPRLPGTSYPFGDLCGVGVAFKLAWSICVQLGDGERANDQLREFLKSAVGLTAIGTVADVVPLLAENRTIVRYGLGSLAQRSSIGLRSLMTLAGIEIGQTLDAEDIGFGIAPRLNAAGRLGQARLAVELLTTTNRDRATQLAQYLEELNRNRRTVERRIFKSAKEMVEAKPEWEDHHALVLADASWHAGVIGIVASRIAETFQKPAILMTIDRNEGVAHGSGRSFGGYNLYDGLVACADTLVRFGGHHAACGVHVSEDRLDDFRQQLSQHASTHQVPREVGEIRIDAEVRLADVTRHGVKELDRLGPFGEQNPRPVFAANRVELAAPPKTMGEGGRHLDIRVKQHGTSLRAIAFGRGEWAEEIAAVDGTIDIGFTAGINRFRGRENVELRLEDWQPSTATPSE
ncbi:single-stranded-DNA-specific exonuclease RecJ [Thalassoroseus pseudoceratinae]|uniref:single-stranded-DNA-specific exonuclease RecJ n=1 Tax=Thalassoroseus pseudoceratinae TaxID=2713176 RepID=UPI00141F0204|nr:single-stranded-DNA-specific exonuclease RecJ [Thalassoroseus pseudoceratinae]